MLEAEPWTLTLEPHPEPTANRAGIVGYRIRNAAADILAEAMPRPYPVIIDRKHLQVMASAPALSAVLMEALQAWSDKFDGPQDEDLHLSGADLIEWFTSWRLRAREALKAAGVEA